MVSCMHYKNTLIKIKKSFGRYLSLFLIAMLGVGFFAGLQTTAPDMVALADQYYNDYHLMDFKITSSLGLTDEDVNVLNHLHGVAAVVPSYSLDVLAQDKVIRVHAMEETVNMVRLKEGRMPERDNECVADNKTYKIGDSIKITSSVDGKLKNNEYTVVGTAESVLYLAEDYGSTTIGDGKLSSYIYINRSSFTLDTYTEIYLTASGKQDMAAYSKDYETLISKLSDELEQLADIEHPQWYIFDRDAAIGYTDLKSGIDVVSSVAAVFPFFFMLIGMLMTSNSMARMIAEERSELGTLTSLGYKDSRIILTYLFYVLSASGMGALAGFLIGCRVIPPIIYSNFRFILPPLTLQYPIPAFLSILAVTVLLMSMVTILACNKELKQQPSALMRPVPPKNGQTVLLEKITPVWKRLSFTWKVTMRNMFRYKLRGFMTIVGVAGCTSFLLAGFGLRDSMSGVAHKQYHEIFRYEDMIILKGETETISQELRSLMESEKIEDPLLIKQSVYQCGKDDRLDVYLIVPENKELFENYYNLKSKDDGSRLRLADNGAVITQKLSELLKVKQGDEIEVKDADSNVYKLKVTGVAENYTGNYIYMDRVFQESVFGKTTTFNAVISNHDADAKELAGNLIDSGLVLNVVYTNNVMQQALDSIESLNGIIILIIAVASLLAIIVLYNLTSVNISERTREIATLKVLGFRDGETNGYIYREAFLLTLLSIGVGLFQGVYLHGFVVDAMQGDTTVFMKEIKWSSFLLASVITILFSIIMQIITYFKLQKINMIESLKSVE